LNFEATKAICWAIKTDQSKYSVISTHSSWWLSSNCGLFLFVFHLQVLLFCSSLFFVLPLYCLFTLWLLITPLIPSNFSCCWYYLWFFINNVYEVKCQPTIWLECCQIYCLITTNNSGPIFPEAKVEVIYIYTSMLI
jgi:hypothetical protein